MSTTAVQAEIESFREYLRTRYKSGTVHRYGEDVQQYLSQIGAEAAHTARHHQISAYVNHLRRRVSPGRISAIVSSIKAYYRYLLETGVRTDHPCRSVSIRDAKRGRELVEELFSDEELEQLLQRKERFSLVAARNRVMLMFLIYQGLTSGELVGLRTGDVDLSEAVVHVRGTGVTEDRTLPLRARQIMALHTYLRETRPRLVTKKKHDILIVSHHGEPEWRESVAYVVRTCRVMFPGRKLTPQTIRMSVARNLLRSGKDVRIVQAYMGQRTPHTTERYKPDGLEELKKTIQQYHPLG